MERWASGGVWIREPGRSVEWRAVAGRPRSLQQTTFLVGAIFAVGSATNEWWDISVVGAVTLLLGATTLVIAQRQIGTYPVITAVIGAGAMVAGSP